MPDASNSTVKITIQLTDANSGAVIGQVTKNLQGVNAAGKAAGAGVADGAKRGVAALSELGNAGTSAGSKLAQGMHDGDRHALTALDNVRLLSQTLGLRLPRAMEAAISRNAALMGGIAALGTGLLALGSIEVFARMADDAYKLFKNLGDVNSEMRKYAAEAAGVAQSKLIDAGSVETLRSMQQQSQGTMDAINDKRRRAGVGEDGSGSVVQYLGYGYLSNFQAYKKGDEKQLVAAQQVNDAVKERLHLADQQEAVEARTADSTARVAALEGAAARAAKQRGEESVASLKLQQAQENEQFLHRQSVDARMTLQRAGVHREENLPHIYQPDPNAGRAEYMETMRRIREQSGAEGTADVRKQRDETAHIDAEAQGASLRGEAKYLHDYEEAQRQLKQAHDETLINDQNFYKRRTDLAAQYQADRQKRLDMEHAETVRVQAEASAGGQTGYARLDAEHTARIDAITKQAPDFSDPDTAGQRRAAENGRYRQEQEKAQGDFADRLRSMDEGRADTTMSVNQRIEAETQRHRNEILKEYQDLYGGLAAMDPRRIAGAQQMNAELAQINAAGAREIAQNRRQVEDQTAKVEADAARSGLTREQQARQAILDEYTERYRALEELRTKDADNADLYRRQEIAAEQVKNGKLLENERQMRDQLAGELRGLMDNPLQELKKIGEDQASKFAADLILKHTGQASGNAGTGGGRGSALTDLLGLGGHSTGGWMNHGIGQRGALPGGVPHTDGTPADPAKAPPVVTASSNVSTASTTLRASSAVIYVTQATFAGMGAGSSAGDAGTAVPAAAAIARGGGSISSADVPNFGFPNLSPGAPSTTADLGGSLPSAGGDSTSTYRALSSTTGAAGAATPGRVGGALSDVGQTLALGGQIASAFAGGGNAGASAGGDDSAPGSGWGLSGSDLPSGDGSNAPNTAKSTSSALNKVGGVIGAGAGLFSAATGNGGAGGALKGAESGAQLGAMIGGPIGMAIGAAAGALVGFIGPGGAAHAEEYYQKTVRPRIAADIMGFGMGAMDYQTAYNDLIALDQSARKDMKQFGMGGKGVWDGKVHPDIINAQHELTREQKAGRNQYGMNAAEYHNGGPIGDGLGGYPTVGGQRLIHAEDGEFMVQRHAVPSHYQALQMINSGGSHSDLASFYGAGGGSTQPPQSGGDTHLHIHAIDTQSGMDFLMANKHGVRAAMNQSYAENSGGADLG